LCHEEHIHRSSLASRVSSRLRSLAFEPQSAEVHSKANEAQQENAYHEDSDDDGLPALAPQPQPFRNLLVHCHLPQFTIRPSA
jgi:hypothetical protein